MANVNPPLLFLCHRLPFPPNKGDKIRSWHLLKHLAKKYDVFIGTFIDDEQDWQYTSHVQSVCADSYFARLKPTKAKLKSLAGIFTGQALSIPYYFNTELQQWVKQIVETHQIKSVVVYSSAMAQYVLDPTVRFEKKIIDFVDVDSDKWQQYASKKSWPLSLIYNREAKKLLAFDRKIAQQFDHSLFVSSHEVELFKSLAPESSEKITSYRNGVDSKYFSPEPGFENPYALDEKPIVFTGAMDYWPNIDAVVWFANDIFPKIKRAIPQAVFYIVGSNPTDEVIRLKSCPGVKVTGRVQDVRPYLKHASLAVAPMRIARGVQNKVLEAMAMDKIVVVTLQGLEGINAENGNEVLIAYNAAEFADLVEKVLTDKKQAHIKDLSKNLPQYTPRERILKDFNWDENLRVLDQLLADSSFPQ